MPACHIKPADKKAFIGKIGLDLVKTHGKWNYYNPADIRRSADRCSYPIEIYCWAYCFFLPLVTSVCCIRLPEKSVIM